MSLEAVGVFPLVRMALQRVCQAGRHARDVVGMNPRFPAGDGFLARVARMPEAGVETLAPPQRASRHVHVVDRISGHARHQFQPVVKTLGLRHVLRQYKPRDATFELDVAGVDGHTQARAVAALVGPYRPLHHGLVRQGGDLLQRGVFAGWTDVEQRHGQQFGARIPVGPQHRVIHGKKAARFAVEHVGRQRIAVEQITIFALHQAQAVTRVGQLGDVLLGATQHALSGGLVEPFAARVHGAHDAIDADHAELDVDRVGAAARRLRRPLKVRAVVGMDVSDDLRERHRRVAHRQAGHAPYLRRPLHLIAVRPPQPVTDPGDAARLAQRFVEAGFAQAPAQHRPQQRQPQQAQKHGQRADRRGEAAKPRQQVGARAAHRDHHRVIGQLAIAEHAGHAVELADAHVFADGCASQMVEERRVAEIGADEPRLVAVAQGHRAIAVHHVDHTVAAEVEVVRDPAQRIDAQLRGDPLRLTEGRVRNGRGQWNDPCLGDAGFAEAHRRAHTQPRPARHVRPDSINPRPVRQSDCQSHVAQCWIAARGEAHTFGDQCIALRRHGRIQQAQVGADAGQAAFEVLQVAPQLAFGRMRLRRDVAPSRLEPRAIVLDEDNAQAGQQAERKQSPGHQHPQSDRAKNAVGRHRWQVHAATTPFATRPASMPAGLPHCPPLI